MTHLTYLLISILIVSQSSCSAPVNSKGPNESNTVEEKTAENITTHKYGAGDVVFSGYLDRAGNMWFATSQEGVFIYDGKRFANISKEDGLCSNVVNAILEDTDGVMWFGTDVGLCRYDHKGFSRIELPIYDSADVSPITGLASRKTQTILSLIQDRKGDFWIGTDASGAYRYDGQQFIPYLKFEGKIQSDNVYNNCITNIIEDKNGHIWIGSFTHGGLHQYDGLKMKHHPLKDDYGDGMISTSYKDKNGDLWFGTRNGGIYKYDYQKFTNIFDSLTGEQIAMASVIEDTNGTIWIGSFARKGVYTYKNGSIQALNIKGSDKLNDIKFISEDMHGNLWFGGRYGLLWKYDGQTLTDFTQLKRI